MKNSRFTFERGQGVVWVCDIENSSKYLNNNESVQDIETFLPRLHWMGKAAVSAAGGQFVKWTGDGFLGWFPMELYRDLGSQSAKVIQIIWHLTLINNVTKLGIERETAFHLRHGLTMEHDALITKVSDEKGEHFDLIGRSVVLAFRLSGIKSNFPNLVTQREIVEAVAKENTAKISFKKLNFSAEDKLKFFKGEMLGTKNLYASAERRPRPRSKSSFLRSIRKAIDAAENPETIPIEDLTMIRRFLENFESGPRWSKEVLKAYLKFVQVDLLGTLNKVVHVINSVP